VEERERKSLREKEKKKGEREREREREREKRSYVCNDDDDDDGTSLPSFHLENRRTRLWTLLVSVSDRFSTVRRRMQWRNNRKKNSKGGEEEREGKKERKKDSSQPPVRPPRFASCSRIHATTLSASLPISSRDQGSSSAPQKWSSPFETSSRRGSKAAEELAAALSLRALSTPSTAVLAALSPQNWSQSPIVTSTGKLGTAEREEEKHFRDPRASEAAAPSGGETATTPPISTRRAAFASPPSDRKSVV
jgi:hypothetical protein